MENRVEALRRQYGIRQEELAQAMGVSRQSIGSIENGRYNPSTQLAIKLAHYFGLTVEDVFVTDDAPTWRTAARLKALPEDTLAGKNYVHNHALPLPKGLIMGQGNRYPSAFVMGTFNVAYNGAVPVALYNTWALLGLTPSLAETILELEGNGVVLLDGYAGVDPRCIGSHLTAHDIPYMQYETPTALSGEVEEGDVCIISYWNDRFFRENKGLNTVTAQYIAGAWVVYNFNMNDTAPRTYRTLPELLRGKKLIVGYRVRV